MIEYGQSDGPRHDPGRPRGRARASSSSTSTSTGPSRRPTTSRRSGRSASRSAASSAPSRASCRSRSWASRRTAATTTSRSGAATRTRSCPRRDDRQKPSQIGLWAIGGIIEHLGALTAVTASTVNSYRRLWDTGFWAPVFADWGYQNRTTALRVSAPGRFEYRSVDSAVNPYLSLRRADHGDAGRHRAQARPGRAGGAEHLRGDGGGQGGQEDPDDLRRRARRARGGRGGESRRCPARCTVSSCTTSATSGSATAPR